MIKPCKIIFIRHAPAEKASGCLPENDPNAIISEPAIKNLSSELPEDCDWYVSPLKRTVQTANAISRYISYKSIIIEHSLREQSFGDWAGKEISEVWEELESNDTQHNFSFFSSNVIPPNGDSFLEQCNRVSIWLENLNFSNEGKVFIVFAHAGTIRAALSHILEIEPDKVLGTEILHLSLTVVEVLQKVDEKKRGGRYRLLGLNKNEI